MAEFAYNNTLHTSTSVTPFFANYGLHPRFSIVIPIGSVNPFAKERARLMKEVHNDLSQNSPLLRNDTKGRFIDISRLYLILKSATWSGYYVGIFRQLAHAPNLITKSWVRSASLINSTLWLYVLLFHHTTEFTMSSMHHFLSSIIHPQFQEEVLSHPPCGFGDRR